MKNILNGIYKVGCLVVLPLVVLSTHLQAQIITSPPEGSQTRNFQWEYDRYVEVEEYGVHIFATETVSDWMILGSHDLVRNMIGALQSAEDRAAFNGVQVHIVTDADAPLTGAGLRAVGGGNWVGFNESGIGKYSISEYFWNPNRVPRYSGWGISVHEFGHVMESTLGLRSRTAEVYNANGITTIMTERFAWGVQAWFNSPGGNTVEHRRNVQMPDWQYEFYSSIFDPANTWTPDNSPRPTPYHRDSNPPSSKMLDDFNFNSLLGRYQFFPTTRTLHEGELTLDGTNEDGDPIFKWSNEAGQSWLYEPYYHSAQYRWTLTYIEGSAVNVPDSQAIYNFDPVEQWDVDAQNYGIAGGRFRTAFYKKISSANAARPFKSPKQVLFADPFNRRNGNLSAPLWGWGSLGRLSYTAKTTHSGVVMGIDNRSLLINGPAASNRFGGIAYINHNFVDDEIFPSYRLNISVDISAYSTVGSARHMGVSLGQSLAELEALESASPEDSPADLFVAYRKTTDTLEIYKNGVLISEETMVGGLPDAPTKMTIQLDLTSDFSAGEDVHYDVYFDDNKYASAFGFFTWSGTNENYIALSSNLSNDSRFDNLEISTVRPFTLPQNTESSDADALIALDALEQFQSDTSDKISIEEDVSELTACPHADGHSFDLH